MEGGCTQGSRQQRRNKSCEDVHDNQMGEEDEDDYANLV
jgi:hypothetical protein